MSLQDLGRLADFKTISGDAGTIVFWPFDIEDHPARAGWHIIGLIFARRGDLGEVPVGGFLWARRPSHLVGSSGSSPDGSVSATFEADKSTDGCQSPRFKFTLKSGGEVLAGGKVIAIVK